MIDVILYWMLFRKASGVKHSDAWHDCESVTPAFDHWAAKAFLVVYPLCLMLEPKKCHPHL
jgi:hypothetical protein